MSAEESFGDGLGPVNLETTIRYHHELRDEDEVGVSCAFGWGAGKTHQVEQELRRTDDTPAAGVAPLTGLLDLRTGAWCPPRPGAGGRVRGRWPGAPDRGRCASDGSTRREGLMMFVPVTSILVDDQDKALAFYTNVLGFAKKTDIPVGDAKWLTVVSPDAPDGVELLLEPDGNPGIQIDGKPAAHVYKKTLYDAGIPFTMLGSTDLIKDYERMTELGVRFIQEPTKTDFGAQAVFDDTCGNLILLVQHD